MSIIREQHRILRIFSTDRQTEQFRQKSGLLVNLVHYDAVISRIGTDQILEILRKIQRTRCGITRMIIVDCGDRLYLFKERIALFFFIGINIYDIFQFMNDVKNPSVPAEFDMTGCRFHFTADNICQCQLTGLMVEAVYLDMIHAKICCTQIMIVPRHLHTADVGTEIPLCNTAQSTMENLIRNLSDTAVLL